MRRSFSVRPARTPSAALSILFAYHSGDQMSISGFWRGVRHRSGRSLEFLFCGMFLSVYIHSVLGGHPYMPNSLPELEAERSKILRQFTALGDLRSEEH